MKVCILSNCIDNYQESYQDYKCLTYKNINLLDFSALLQIDHILWEACDADLNYQYISDKLKIWSKFSVYSAFVENCIMLKTIKIIVRKEEEHNFSVFTNDLLPGVEISIQIQDNEQQPNLQHILPLDVWPSYGKKNIPGNKSYSINLNKKTHVDKIDQIYLSRIAIGCAISDVTINVFSKFDMFIKKFKQNIRICSRLKCKNLIYSCNVSTICNSQGSALSKQKIKNNLFYNAMTNIIAYASSYAINIIIVPCTTSTFLNSYQETKLLCDILGVKCAYTIDNYANIFDDFVLYNNDVNLPKILYVFD